jgi:predicted RNase H-like HicB family nuclease
MSKFLVIFEKAEGNYSAFCPDIPGCVATGRTREEAEKNIKSAISAYIHSLTLGNLRVSLRPEVSAKYVEVK